MIQLTRLNNQPMALNSDLIKFVEQAPDTVITLTTGEKLVVRESAEEVIQRVIRFRREVLRVPILESPVTPDLSAGMEAKPDHEG